MPIDISGADRVEVVGESFYREALRRVAAAIDGSTGSRECVATLVPDPSNPYDRNAVKVVVGDEHVGHLPRDLAALAAPGIAELAGTVEVVTTRAELCGSDADLGFGVVLTVDLGSLGIAMGEEEDEALPPSAVVPTVRRLSDPPQDHEEKKPAPPKERHARIERAVEHWKTDLIDLTARNRLLYMRDLRTGTFSLDRANREQVMELIAGKRLLLSKLVPRALQPENPLAKLTPFEDALRRTRAIARTARSYEEERGVRTLFLACGVATWKSDRATRPPAAPVLLVPIDIRARGASQQDFELSTAGDLEVNPTLLHLLRVEFNLQIDEEELLGDPEMDGAIDTHEELRLAFNWLSAKCASIEGWAVAERFVLGNFWYAKLPMVRDLEASVDVLATHDVASALAGDEEARRAVIEMRQKSGAAELPELDDLLPEEELHVLDSDSSQSQAIARALSGRNLVLKGPPGTGKSQTIANLIAGAIGSGKSVLFVAEKRAAIEAVTKRLEATGLGNLVLDLHRGRSRGNGWPRSSAFRWTPRGVPVGWRSLRTAPNWCGPATTCAAMYPPSTPRTIRGASPSSTLTWACSTTASPRSALGRGARIWKHSPPTASPS